MKIVFFPIVLLSWCSAFILPSKFFIWSELHQSIAIVFSILIASFFIVKNKFKLDEYAYFCLSFILISIIVFLGRKTTYHSYLVIAIFFILVSFCAYSIGKILPLHTVLKAISFAMIFVCIFNIFIQFLQVNHLEWLPVEWINNFNNPTDRPSANIAQPNRLASIYLSIAAILYLAVKENVLKSIYLWVMLIPFSYGISLTQSRTGYLVIIVLALITLIQKNEKAGLKAYFSFMFACSITVKFLLHTEKNQASRELLSNLNNGRFDLWNSSLIFIKNSPWLGYGVNETARAHFLNSETSKITNILAAQAHNIFLDFFIWFGIPLGGFLSIILLYVIIKTIIKNKKSLYKIIPLVPLLIHAQLEYPLYYANGLLLFSLLLGIANNSPEVRQEANDTHATFSLFPLITLQLFAFVLFVELISLEIGLTQQRNYYYGFSNEKFDSSNIIFMDIPKDYIHTLSIRPDEKWKEKEIKIVEELCNYFVSSRYYATLVKFYTLAGDEESANFWLSKSQRLNSVENAQRIMKLRNELLK